MLHPLAIEKSGFTNAHQIKNIIFDLGNVLIDIDLDKTIEKFRLLGVPSFDDLFSFEKQSHIFEKYETGHISTPEFRDHLRSFIPTPVSDESIDQAWGAMLCHLPQERVALLEKLSSRYRLFLLSNTNESHVNKFVKEADNKYGKGIFNRLFIKTYYSNEIRLRKPDEAVFHYVVNDAGIQFCESLFIDDLLVNVEASRKAGLNAYWLENKNILSIFI